MASSLRRLRVEVELLIQVPELEAVGGNAQRLAQNYLGLGIVNRAEVSDEDPDPSKWARELEVARARGWSG